MIDYKGYRIIKLSPGAYAAGILYPEGDQIELLRIFGSFEEALEYIGYEGRERWRIDVLLQ